MSGVVALVRRPLSPHSVLASALELLRARGVPVCTAVVDENRPLPASARDATLLVLRDVPVMTLAAITSAAAGVPCCNSVEATARTMDKIRTDRLLRAGGVRVPDSEVAVSWAAVRTAAAGVAVAVKPHSGRDGRGVLLADQGTELPHDPPYRGPYLVQALVPGNGVDRKLYAVAGQVFGVLRSWPARSLDDKRGRPYAPTAAEGTTALRAGTALGLEVFGVDLIGDPDDPVVIDVNAMPGFQGVPEMEARLSDHFLGHCRPRRVTR